MELQLQKTFRRALAPAEIAKMPSALLSLLHCSVDTGA